MKAMHHPGNSAPINNTANGNDSASHLCEPSHRLSADASDGRRFVACATPLQCAEAGSHKKPHGHVVLPGEPVRDVSGVSSEWSIAAWRTCGFHHQPECPKLPSLNTTTTINNDHHLHHAATPTPDGCCMPSPELTAFQCLPCDGTETIALLLQPQHAHVTDETGLWLSLRVVEVVPIVRGRAAARAGLGSRVHYVATHSFKQDSTGYGYDADGTVCGLARISDACSGATAVVATRQTYDAAGKRVELRGVSEPWVDVVWAKPLLTRHTEALQVRGCRRDDVVNADSSAVLATPDCGMEEAIDLGMHDGGAGIIDSAPHGRQSVGAESFGPSHVELHTLRVSTWDSAGDLDSGSDCDGAVSCEEDDAASIADIVDAMSWDTVGNALGLDDDEEDGAPINLDMSGGSAGPECAQPIMKCAGLTIETEAQDDGGSDSEAEAEAEDSDGGDDAQTPAPIDYDSDEDLDDIFASVVQRATNLGDEEEGDAAADAPSADGAAGCGGSHCEDTTSIPDELAASWAKAIQDAQGEQQGADGEGLLAGAYSRVGWRGRRRL